MALLPIEDCLLERLSEHHDLSEFTCGRPALDRWLREFALTNDRIDSSRVSVLVEDARVVAFFALTMGSVARADAPRSLVRGMPPYAIGAVVLARLAVASAVQGRGYGRRLLAHAVADSVRAGTAVAARLMIVDAIDEEAAAFYRRYGFRDLPENPFRLFVRLGDAAESMRTAGGAG